MRIFVPVENLGNFRIRHEKLRPEAKIVNITNVRIENGIRNVLGPSANKNFSTRIETTALKIGTSGRKIAVKEYGFQQTE